MEIHFQVGSTSLVVNGGDELLRRFSDIQSFLGKTSALISRREAKDLNVESRGRKSPSVSNKKRRKPPNASGSKGAKIHSEGSSSGIDNMLVDSL